MAVGYDHPSLKTVRKDWLKYNVHLHSVGTAGEAIRQFSRRAYIAVIATYRTPGLESLIAFMGKDVHIPLVILAQGDGGTKFAETIIRGADTFIIDPDELIESIKANKGIITRLSTISPQQRKALGILTHSDIFMLVDYRKVFVRNKEIQLANSEFEILRLLLSQAGRVFTYEQLYLYAYGNDVSLDITANAVRCHIYRIRQRLRYAAVPSDYIDSVRNIGYRITI